MRLLAKSKYILSEERLLFHLYVNAYTVPILTSKEPSSDDMAAAGA